MKFQERVTLTVDQNPNGSYEKEIEGSLLVGDIIYAWSGDDDCNGHHDYDVKPCYWKGEKAWVKGWTWYPAEGYSDTGEGEEILDFEVGVKLLLEKGAYSHLFKEN